MIVVFVFTRKAAAMLRISDWSSDVGSSDLLVWFVLFFVTCVLVVMECFVSSEIGRVWRAIREDRLAAQTAGVPVKRYLLLAFAVSGVFAGLAGGLFAYVQTVVSPESFTVDTSILVLTMAVLGGLGNIHGDRKSTRPNSR